VWYAYSVSAEKRDALNVRRCGFTSIRALVDCGNFSPPFQHSIVQVASKFWPSPSKNTTYTYSRAVPTNSFKNELRLPTTLISCIMAMPNLTCTVPVKLRTGRMSGLYACLANRSWMSLISSELPRPGQQQTQCHLYGDVVEYCMFYLICLAVPFLPTFYVRLLH